MLARAVKRLAAPILSFWLFLAFALFSRDLMPPMGAEGLERWTELLAYGAQIGAWLAGAFLAVRVIDIFFWEGVVQRAIASQVPQLLKDALVVVIFLVAITGIIGTVFHQSVTGIWATSSVVGLVVGLALRNIILDIFSGLAINIDRSYRIGDWVRLHDRDVREEIYGCIVEIHWRTTRIELLDKSMVVVPNSRMGGQVITNFSLPNDLDRFEMTFCLDFSIRPERAIRVLLAGAKAACGRDGLVERPEPQVLVAKTTPLGVEYLVRYWMHVAQISPPIARDKVTRSILEQLDRAGLSLAYPKQDLYIARMPARHLDYRQVEDRIELLSRIDLFAGRLTPEELRSLVDSMLVRTYRTGEALIRQGEPGQSMFVLAEGLLDVTIRGAGNGGEERVGHVTPGEFFGEMSLLTGEQRSATVVAVTDVLAYEITFAQMAALLGRRPALAEILSEAAAARRLRTAATAAGPAADPTAASATLSRHILARMQSFFRTVFQASH